MGIPFLDLYLSGRLQEPAKRELAASAADKPAAAPLWQTVGVLTTITIIVALFIGSSRYADFHHAGCDIIAGAVVGTLSACASFRFHHLPIRRSGSLTWGMRARRHSFMSVLDDEATYEERVGESGDELGNYSTRAPDRGLTAGSGEPILACPNNQAGGRL